MKDNTFIRDPGKIMVGAGTGFSTLQSSTTVSAEGTNQRDDQGLEINCEGTWTPCLLALHDCPCDCWNEYPALLHAVKVTRLDKFRQLLAGTYLETRWHDPRCDCSVDCCR